jgi:hypothetical protein
VSRTAATRQAGADWSLHGARIRFRSNSEEVIAYIRSHLGTDPAGGLDPDLQVAVNWHWGVKAAPPASVDGEAERVSRSIIQRNRRVLWSRVPGFEGLTMEAGPGEEDDTFTISSTCRYVPRDPLARVRYMRAGRRAKKTHRLFFKLLYYVAYYPMIWHLERTRGWGLLHASALEREGRGIILAGHGGVGKSTLALSLMADPSFRFISDNLLLHDGERIYTLPEPIRLDASSMSAVRAAGFRPATSEVPLTAHKKPTYWVDPARLSPSAPAAIVVLLRFTPRPLLRPLSPVETLAQLVAARDLAREVEGYRTVSAFLSMSVADDSDFPTEPASLPSLVTQLQGYVLGIGRGEPVHVTLARLREVCG